MSETANEPNKQKYHFFLVADGGGAPVSLSSDDLESLKKQAFTEIIRAGAGWCHFIIDGQRCLISNPTQLFSLQLPDGTLAELRDPSSLVIDPNGKFSILYPRLDGYGPA